MAQSQACRQSSLSEGPNDPLSQPTTEVGLWVADIKARFQESAHIRDYPESVLPRLVAEAMEALAARIAGLEAHIEDLEAALEECERGHNS